MDNYQNYQKAADKQGFAEFMALLIVRESLFFQIVTQKGQIFILYYYYSQCQILHFPMNFSLPQKIILLASMGLSHIISPLCFVRIIDRLQLHSHYQVSQVYQKSLNQQANQQNFHYHIQIPLQSQMLSQTIKFNSMKALSLPFNQSQIFLITNPFPPKHKESLIYFDVTILLNVLRSLFKLALHNLIL